MKPRFSIVALSATSQNDRVLSIANQCIEVLSNIGIKVLIDKNLSKLKSKSKNAAIENRKLQGKVLMTYLKGESVFSLQ